MQCASSVLSSALLSSNILFVKMPTDDEDECEEENESRTTTAPSGLRNRPRSRHRRQRIRMQEVQSAKRALFQDKHQIDSQTNLNLVQKELEAIIDSSSQQWNFDFRKGKPLRSDNARFIWEPFNLPPNKSRISDSFKVQNESLLNNNNNYTITTTRTTTTTSSTTTSNCDLKCRVNKKRQLTITDYFKVSKRQKSNNGNEEKTTTTTDEQMKLANTTTTTLS